MNPHSPIDPSLLDTFIAIADSGRISAAARVVHRSQPAVTAQLQKLERDLGQALFHRSVRGVTPTDAGTRLLGYARRVRALLDEAAAELDPGGAPSGELLLGASTTIAAHVLPGLLSAFRAKHPQLPIRVEVGNTEQTVARLVRGALPLGLVEGHARAAHLRLEPFVEDELVAVVGRDRPFCPRRVKDLSAVPMIWREPGSGTRAVIERALRGTKLRRTPRADDLELGSTEAVKSAVAAGLGVAFVSRWSLRTEVALGTLHVLPLSDLTIKRTFRWALPAGGLVGASARFYAMSKRSPPVLG